MNSPINIKIVEVLGGDDLGGRGFALFLRPHPGAFRQFMCHHPREFAHFFQKNANARGWPGGGGGGGGAWALLELTDALRMFLMLKKVCQSLFLLILHRVVIIFVE